MNYTGLDVHKEFIYASTVDEEGNKVSEKKFLNSIHALDYFLEKQEKETSFVLEACGMYEPIYDRLEEQGYGVTLAHPLKTKAIASAKIKTDAIDAETLAQLLRANLIPKSHVPDKTTRELRSLVRRRASLVRQRSHLKHQVHSILLKHGLKAPVTDIFGKRGKDWLTKLALPHAERFALDSILSIINAFDEQLHLSETTIDAVAGKIKPVKLLTTIPGIGNYSALLAYADIDDIKRFPTAKKLASYAGMVPSTYQSGSTNRNGPITKNGSKLLRWVLNQAAHKAVETDPWLNRFYTHLVRKKGSQKAITAVARKILTYMYIMLTEGIEYDELYVHRRGKRTTFHCASELGN
jgi:transposase